MFDKNIARGFTGVEFSDSYGSDVATSIVWRNDAQHTSFRDGSSAGYGELVSHNHNSVGNIRVDFHEREEKELEDAYGEDDNEDEGENDSTESYVDGESYSDDFQSVDGQIVTDSDEEVVTDDEGSRLCIKKEALLETMYQSKDPKSLDEAEMLENLFNCLCGLLMPLENRDINAGIKEETSRRDVGDSSLGAVSLEPLKLTKFAKQVAEQLFGRADILELIAVCAIFISASVLVGTHDQLFSYYKSSLMKLLRELAHIFDIKGQMEMTNKLCERLLKQKDQHRDIASIAMKAMVAEVSTQSSAQSILGSILPQSIKGSTARGMNTEIKCECPDILCYALHKFGDIMATDHELLLGALLSQLSSNQINVGKKSVSCIASLASSLSDDLLAKATVRVVQHLSNKGTKYKMTQTSLSQD
ncbi:uncharacterized protein LOC133713412 [Rosa rugosa]|uniref:uncharacterized protein LOC133713412 n=1 Tax=Rosa rugosa TaxID=74645 RepID=UPI002B41610E|nr:uncharacterized protein LOC133713412 [Rosa rugosa]